MDSGLKKLARRIVAYREKVPLPAYDWMRQIYRKYGHIFEPGVSYRPFRQDEAQGLPKVIPGFDIVWYLQNYGHTFDTAKIDPYSHYLETGKAQGYAARPPGHVQFDKTASLALPKGARRACLFAGYDPDGIIDDYVLIYLRELARHADIFYLADCEMHAVELRKLDGIVKGAWAKRHGAYDFGSYSALARDFVGWDTLSTYDEVIFANDSVYLVQPLDDVFETMAERPVAWWGLQATKGLAATRKKQPFPVAADKIHMDEVQKAFLNIFEDDPIYDFHVGSYFVCFRKHIINDIRFQRVINTVEIEENKVNIILRYEVGITHFLIGHGYEFSTYGPYLTKAHPVYSDAIFDLLANGFPLFKRFILTKNHYKSPSTSYWKAALERVGSITSCEVIERNYQRIADSKEIYDGFRVVEDGILPAPPMPVGMFLSYDEKTPKYDHYWGFPVCAFDHNLSDNARSVFEYIKDDPHIRKIVFTRDRCVQLEGRNITIVPLLSREGQMYLARCRNLFVKHGASKNLHWRIQKQHHNVINLWHGIPLKRIGTASLDLGHKRDEMFEHNKKLRAVISASDVDRLAMSAAFEPLPIEDVWLTGLPRHDAIQKPESELSNEQCDQLRHLRELIDGRKLILFCPTFRNDQDDGYYKFTAAEVDRLAAFLADHDMIMGIREHPNDQSRQYSSQLTGERFIRVQSGLFPDVEMIYREADMLVTDYSSCFFDFMLTGRPMISFAYDLDTYKQRERGLFYELEDVFPGPISRTFDALIAALDGSRKTIGKPPSADYMMKRNFFIKYRDCENSARVFRKTKELCTGSTFSVAYQNAKSERQDQSVVFLHSDDLHEKAKRSVFSLATEMKVMGWTCQVRTIRNVDPKLVLQAEYVVFCGLALDEVSLDTAEVVKENGGKVIYAADSLIHDQSALMQSDVFLENRHDANKMCLQSANTAQMMALADGFIATTSAILRSVERFQKPAAIVRDSLPATLLKTYSKPPERDPVENINIVYLARATQHSANLAVCQSALLDVLLQRPHVILHIVGPFDADDIAKRAANQQVRRHRPMGDDQMHAFLRKMDLNLVPLTDTAFNDAESPMNVVEAALHEIPTIASPSESYCAVIEDRVTGFLARTSDEWRDILLEVIDDTEIRQNAGTMARRRIVPVFAAATPAQQLSDFLVEFQ